jgi:DNA primase
VRRFRIGVASPAWNDLVARLADKGIAPGALVRAGLVAERAGGDTYDRFRGRLVFPIAGLDGEVIGFGGRVLPGEGVEKLAKYINSPETAVYKKSRVLFGLEHAREHVRRTRQAILVEGYFDVVGLHQAGVRNAVAVCGTALAPEHVDVLKRCDCRELVVLFDGDAAGVAALSRSAHAILPSVVAAKVALLPRAAGDVDPDEFARRSGGAAVEKLVAEGRALTEFLIDAAERRHCGGAAREASLEAKRAAYAELRPFVVAVPKGFARSTFEKRVAERLDVNLDALRAELDPSEDVPRSRPEVIPADHARRAPPGAPRQVNVATRSAPGLVRLWGPEVDALGLLASFPDLAAVAAEERLVDVVPSGTLQELARELLDGARPTADELLARMRDVLDPKALRRVADLLGAGRPDQAQAERELRRAVVRGKIELVEQEIARLLGAITRAGAPVPDDLQRDYLRAAARLKDLKERLRSA